MGGSQHCNHTTKITSTNEQHQMNCIFLLGRVLRSSTSEDSTACLGPTRTGRPLVGGLSCRGVWGLCMNLLAHGLLCESDDCLRSARLWWRSLWRAAWTPTLGAVQRSGVDEGAAAFPWRAPPPPTRPAQLPATARLAPCKVGQKRRTTHMGGSLCAYVRLS